MSERLANIDYVLFDLDGLLIDSETLDTHVVNTILSEYGQETNWEIKAGCMGKPERVSAAFLLSHFPSLPLTIDTYIAKRTELQSVLWHTITLLPGVERLLNHLKKHNVPMAIATGSKRSKYEAKVAHLPLIGACFHDAEAKQRVICSSDEELVQRGKPDPDIFLAAARELLGRDVGYADVTPTPAQVVERSRGLVFEDAVAGMQAGKRAGMQVLWVPDPHIQDLVAGLDEQPDKTILSLEEFKPEEWGLPPFDPET
ncbi:HAD-like domain-containing protein [Coprinopsis sp. MPI-PUGE-AT-0042]|nr:HAD-like domain-containing protein [Coprinopsis sp. MPI-PUGE-AT-0042]